MATSTVSAMAKLMKTVYEPTWQTAFKELYTAFKLAKEESRDFANNNSETFPVEIGRSSGTGMRGEAGDLTGTGYMGLPSPQAGKIEHGYIPLKRMYGTMQFTDDAIRQTKNSVQAFKRLLDYEFKSKFNRMLFDAEFQLAGDGSGVRAIVTADGTDITAGNSGDVTVDTTRYLVEGDSIAFWNSGDTNVVANGGQDSNSADKVTITKVKNETTITVKNGGSGTLAAASRTGTRIRLFGDSTYSSGRVDHSFTGLGAAIDDSNTYANIDRSTYPIWGSAIVDAASAVLEEDHIIKAVDKVARRSGESIDTVIWDVSLRRDYVSITRPDRRYAPVKELDAGYSEEALVFTAGNKKIRLVEDTFWPYGQLVGISKANLKMYTLVPLELDDSNGSVLKQFGTPMGATGAGDVFYSFMRWKGNFCLERPYAAMKVKNLQYALE